MAHTDFLHRSGRLISQGNRRSVSAAPGVLLCVAVTGAALALQTLEIQAFGRAWLEALVIAILAGTTIRTLWTPGPAWRPGIEFSAKVLLEFAVVLLGTSISAQMVINAGPALLFGVAGVVGVALLASYGIGRLFRLPHRMATLIACGNAICGNSAIAAVAPVIGADAEDVAASIAFTAVLGVAVVLGLPLLALALHMTPWAFGVFAGLTVYAVPQVLAATAPVSAASTQIGALVKLVRVLMLGPIVLGLTLLDRRDREAANTPAPDVTAGDRPQPRRLTAHHLVPWFIIGFVVMISARSMGLVPGALLAPVSQTSSSLTIVSMAALGLGVDLRVVLRAGPQVTAAVTLSIAMLGLISFGLIMLLGLH